MTVEQNNSDQELVNRWWHSVRPYWHVGSFIVLATFIVTTNWSKVAAYETRIVSVEDWKVESSRQLVAQGRDIAVMKQQLNDIHDYLIPKVR